ncbi:hypothetical protein C8R46DRAFT_1341654 [Mycena filopes]|nr:hypothetical protein C8R46DRAFT_1341654 [Mycena filopes]
MWPPQLATLSISSTYFIMSTTTTTATATTTTSTKTVARASNEMKGTLPDDFTMHNLSGRFVLNKPLSSPDPFGWIPARASHHSDSLALQSAIAAGVLSFNHFTSRDDGVEQVWVHQEIANTSTTEEGWVLNRPARLRDPVDPVFGPAVSGVERINLPNLKLEEPPFLRAGWTPDTRRQGVLRCTMRSAAAEGGGWCVVETWGIEGEIKSTGGGRRFCRHVVFTPAAHEGEHEQGREREQEQVERHLVYDYLGGV